MKPWSLLPNAQLIDWVIESAQTNPDSWGRAWDAARTATHYAAWNTAYDAAWNEAYDAIIDTDLETAWYAAWDATYDASGDSILALIAYDDCDWYLAMTYEQLSVYAVLSDKPQAVLLLPFKWVQENETVVTPT